EPDVRAVTGLVGPDRAGAPDDAITRQRPEIASVEAVRRAQVHHEDLAIGDGPAPVPRRQDALHPVACARRSGRATVDRDRKAVAAYGVARKRCDLLDERHARRKVAALREVIAQPGRRIERDALADGQSGCVADVIKTGRYA